MSDQQQEPDYVLTIRFEPGTVPTIIRLRKLLKTARRWYGATAIRIEEVRPGTRDRPGQGHAEA
jgi:hypothetical protein